MSVAIHPSETRRTDGPPVRSRRRVLAGLAGGVALLAFATGAFSFFSGLADPRVRSARVAPTASVASQWPNLKDGVPALATGPTEKPPELRVVSLPAATPPAPSPALSQTPPEPVQAARPVPQPAPARASLPIEPVETVPSTARTATPVVPAKVAAPLAPTRAETVRAKNEPAKTDTIKTEATKAEQPARFVSLPAPKAKADAARVETAKSEAVKPGTAKADPVRKAAAPARTRTPEAKPAQTALAEPPAAPAGNDEPELLGVKIPGGRQIREGWDSAVNGLLGGKSGNP